MGLPGDPNLKHMLMYLIEHRKNLSTRFSVWMSVAIWISTWLYRSIAWLTDSTLSNIYYLISAWRERPRYIEHLSFSTQLTQHFMMSWHLLIAFSLNINTVTWSLIENWLKYHKQRITSIEQGGGVLGDAMGNFGCVQSCSHTKRKTEL